MTLPQDSTEQVQDVLEGWWGWERVEETTADHLACIPLGRMLHKNCFTFVAELQSTSVTGSSRSWRKGGKSVPVSHGLEVRLMGENMSQGWNQGHYANVLVATMALNLASRDSGKASIRSISYPTTISFLILQFSFPIACIYSGAKHPSDDVSSPQVTSKLSWQGSLFGYVSTKTLCCLLQSMSVNGGHDGWHCQKDDVMIERLHWKHTQRSGHYSFDVWVICNRSSECFFVLTECWSTDIRFLEWDTTKLVTY